MLTIFQTTIKCLIAFFIVFCNSFYFRLLCGLEQLLLLLC